MDEAPEDRRKRLKAMRASAGKQPTSDSTAASTGVKDGSGSKKLKFRNYQPYDESLLRQNQDDDDEEGAAYKSMRVELGADLATYAVVNGNMQLVEGSSGNMAKSRGKKKDRKAKPTDAITEELKAAERLVKNANHAPEKALDPTQDLKDQIEGKLAKLRRRTQKSIVDILRSSGTT